MKRFVGILVLTLAAAVAAPLAAQEKKAEANDKVKKIASCKAIMVVKLTEISGVSYSGIVGSRFLFEVEKFVEFKADGNSGGVNTGSFNELLKRRNSLGDYYLLEYWYEYPSLEGGSGIGPPTQPSEADRKRLKKNKAAHKKLLKLLKKGQKYILAAPSAKAFCPMTGAVMPNKWGHVLPDSRDEIIVEKYAGSTLKKIESLLREEEKEEKSSAELKKKIDELIKKLGDENYKAREEAQEALKKIGRPAISQLREAVKSKDLEVQRRAKQILTDLNLVDPDAAKRLKVTLRVNKKTLKKDDKFTITVEWKNTGKDDVIVQRKLKTHPLMVLEVKGDLAMNIGRWGELSPEDMQRLADSPLTIKPGKKVTARIEAHGWYEATFTDKNGNWQKELRLQLGDDRAILGFKKGTYTITATTTLADGTVVRSKPIKIEVK